MGKKERLIEFGLLALILCLGGFLRFYNLSYGIGSHPDERFMISVVEKLRLSDMNPKSFAYGSLPYYLLWATSEALGLIWPALRSYDGLFLVGRSLCALLGLCTVVLTYFLAKRLSGKWLGLMAAALLSLNFFHIQLSRFFTSDIVLTACSCAALLGMIALAERGSLWIAVITGLAIGASMAAKVSALILGAPLAVSILGAALQAPKPWLSFLKHSALVGLVCFFTFALCEPYAFLDFTTFLAHTKEQTGMARGLWRPPYTIQYANTAPYLYHLEQMFNYTIGWPVCLLALSGALSLGYCLTKSFSWKDLILPVWLLAFFGATAGLQVKFPRYLLPLYPQIAILAAFGLRPLLALARQETAVTSGEAILLERAPGLGILPELSALKGRVRLPPSVLAGAFLMFALLLFGVTLVRARMPGPAFTFAAWIGSIGCALAALSLLPPARSSAPEAKPFGWFSFSAILLVAALLRLVFLERLPFNLDGDEMNFGLSALRLSAAGVPLFSSSWINMPNVVFGVDTLSMELLGRNLFGLRCGTALLGVLSVVGLYALMRDFFNSRTAALAAILASFSHLHLHFSRTGYNYVPALAFAVWGAYFCAKGIRTTSFVSFGVSGVLLGLGTLLHVPAVCAFIACLVLLASEVLRRRRHRGHLLGGAAVLCCMSFFTLAPLLLTNLSAFLDSFRRHYVFSAGNAAHVAGSLGSTDFWPVISSQAPAMLKFLFSGSDTSLQYGLSAPHFDPLNAVCLAAGILICIRRIRNGAAIFLLAWALSLTIFFGFLTINTPFSPWLIAFSFLFSAFIAIAYEELLKYLKRVGMAKAGTAAVCALVVVWTYWQSSTYFGTYRDKRLPERRDYLTRLLLEHPEVKSIINTTPQLENFEHESFALLAPGLKGGNATPETHDGEFPVLFSELPTPLLVLSTPAPEVLNVRVPGMKSVTVGETGSGETAVRWSLVK